VFTYLSTLVTKGHGHIKIPQETNPYIRIVLDHRNMMAPPVDKFVRQRPPILSLQPFEETKLTTCTMPKKEAIWPCTVSLGLRLGTLSKKKAHNTVSNSKLFFILLW
jgi:hypothetical protein